MVSECQHSMSLPVGIEDHALVHTWFDHIIIISTLRQNQRSASKFHQNWPTRIEKSEYQ